MTEIGRPPWLVSGMLTAADAASHVTAPRIAFTLVLYPALYVALILALSRSSSIWHATSATPTSRLAMAMAARGVKLEDQLNVVNNPEKEGPAHA